MVNVRLAGIWHVVIFSDAINMINVELCMIVVHMDLYLFIPLSMTLIVFQGHSSVKQFRFSQKKHNCGSVTHRFQFWFTDLRPLCQVDTHVFSVIKTTIGEAEYNSAFI